MIADETTIHQSSNGEDISNLTTELQAPDFKWTGT